MGTPHSLPKLTVSEWLSKGEARLHSSSFILRPRRHTELLIEAATGLDRTAIYLNAGRELSEEEEARLQQLLQRRLAGEPVQYIVGWAPFYGERYRIERGVFIPRFDSEVIAQVGLKHLAGRDEKTLEVLDLCCGCGAIGLAIAHEDSRVRLTSVDLSPTALGFTQRNSMELGVSDRVEVVKWNALLDPPVEWCEKFHLIVANPPYIPIGEIPSLHPDVRDHEPRTALTDGGDGLSFYLRWRETIPIIVAPQGLFITEFGDRQADATRGIFDDASWSTEVLDDVSGNPRALAVRFA